MTRWHRRVDRIRRAAMNLPALMRQAWRNRSSWRTRTALRYAVTMAAVFVTALPPPLLCGAEVVVFDSDANGANGVTEAGGTFTWVPGSTATFFNGSMIDVVAGAGQIAQFGGFNNVLGSTATIHVGTGSVGGLFIGSTQTSSYALTASSASTLTLGSDGIVIGSGARATTVGSALLSFSLGANQQWTSNTTNLTTFAGAIDLTDKTLTLAASGSGAITVSGAISGSGGLTVDSAGGGITRLIAANTYTGDTRITRGVLNLDFSNSSILTNIVNNSAVDSKLVLGGGTLTLTGKSGQTNSQAFNNTDITSGASTVTLTQNGASSLTVDLGAITRVAGTNGTLNFSVTPLASGVVALGSSSLTSGIIGPWATTGTGTTLAYATISGGQVLAYAGATVFATPTAVTGTDATTNIDLTSGLGTMPAGTVANTIRLEATSGFTTTLAGSLAVNGLIHSGSNTVWTITGPNATTSLKSVTGELVIFGSTNVTLNAPITDNGATATKLVYSGTGTLMLGGQNPINVSIVNSFTGGLVINSGTVTTGNPSSTTVFGTGPITIMAGAALRPVSPTGTMVYDNPIIVMGTNGQSTVGTNANSSPLNIRGGVTGQGNLLIANGGNGTTTLSTNPINHQGTVTHAHGFTGATTISAVIGPNVTGLIQNTTHASTPSALNLGGNNTFTSGVTITNGAIIINHAGALNSTNPNAVTFGSGAAARLSLNGFSVAVSSLSSTSTAAVVNNSHATNSSTLTVQAAAGTSSTFAGLLQNGGDAALAVTKTGSGTWIYSGTGSYTGATNVNGGTLVVTGSIGSATNVGATASLVVNGNVNALATVAADGTLQGNGGVGAVVVQNGGTLSPGNSVDSLEITGTGVVLGTDLLTVNGGAKVVFEFLNAQGTPGVGGWDYVDLAAGGALNLTGVNSANKIELDIVSYLPDNSGPGAASNFTLTQPAAYQWLFIQADELKGIDEAELNANYLDYFDIDDEGVFGGDDPFARPLGPGNVPATFSVAWLGSGPSGSGLYIQFTAVPEPGSMALAALGSVAAAWYGRRRLRDRTPAAAEAPVAAEL